MPASAPSAAVRLYGTEQIDPPLRTLRAGPLSVEFDNGALRYVRIDGIEVLRGISFLVRDENWGTFTPKIEDLDLHEDATGFTVTYRGTCADASRRLVYDARIVGKQDGSLSFVAEALPETDILTNRTGFIVLHPIADLAGKPVKVLHEDGTERMAAFPENIDPRVPFTRIRALSHEVRPGLWATCSMEGEDAFEMEDQRNWSDASYKTYVRSLLQPWPYTLRKGQKFTQAVHLAVAGTLSLRPASGGEQRGTALTLGNPAGAMPAIGVGVPAEETAPALANAELMKRLAPRLLVCQIDLRENHGRRELENYKALSELTGAGVALEIITQGTLDPYNELAPIGEAMRAVGLVPESVSVFPMQDMRSVQPDAPWPEMPGFEESYAAARRAFPGAKLGGGMAAYFTELNRKRPPAALLDYVTFTSCPSVHAADDISVMETLEAVPHLIRSTRAFVGAGKPLRIGPSQLGCRENPYGRSTTPNTDNRRACLSRIDPRQRGLFNAAWSLGYIAAAAREGIDVVTLGAPTGPFGLIHRKTDFVQPWYDVHEGAAVYPAFHVMAGLSELSGAPLVDVAVEGSNGIAVLAARKDGRIVLWVANLTAEPQAVQLADADVTSKVAILSADRFEQIAVDPAFMASAARPLTDGRLHLDAYAVARAELTV